MRQHGELLQWNICQGVSESLHEMFQLWCSWGCADCTADAFFTWGSKGIKPSKSATFGTPAFNAFQTVCLGL